MHPTGRCCAVLFVVAHPHLSATTVQHQKLFSASLLPPVPSISPGALFLANGPHTRQKLPNPVAWTHGSRVVLLSSTLLPSSPIHPLLPIQFNRFNRLQPQTYQDTKRNKELFHLQLIVTHMNGCPQFFGARYEAWWVEEDVSDLPPYHGSEC